jgi:hypothetical protein
MIPLEKQVCSSDLAKRLKELRVKTGFYTTPVGKKASEKMPKLVFVSGQIGLQKAQANQAELQQMIEEKAGKQGGGG